MSRHYVVAIDSGTATAADKDRITESFRTQSFGFWHHFPDIWLLAGVPEHMTAKSIYALIETLVPQASLFVASMSRPGEYWGRAPETGWQWFKANWDPLVS